MTALLGWHGSVTLYRQHPDAAVVNKKSIIKSKNGVLLDLNTSGYWSGDRVVISNPQGLPFAGGGGGSGGPATVDGLRIYGPGPTLGPRAAHRARGDSAKFYQPDNTLPFYDTSLGNVISSKEVWLAVDALDRVRFYTNELDALNGGTKGRIDIIPSLFIGNLTITPVWDDTDGWKCLCSLTAWTIETDPENLDSTAIGQDFGEYVRGLVRGSGSFTGNVSNVKESGHMQAMQTAKLALLSRKGATARGKFMIGYANAEGDCPGTPELYYESEMLMAQTTISLTMDNATNIAANFVMTGEIKLTIEG